MSKESIEQAKRYIGIKINRHKDEIKRLENLIAELVDK